MVVANPGAFVGGELAELESESECIASIIEQILPGTGQAGRAGRGGEGNMAWSLTSLTDIDFVMQARPGQARPDQM